MAKGYLRVKNSASPDGIVVTKIEHNGQDIQVPPELIKKIPFGHTSDSVALEQGNYTVTAALVTDRRKTSTPLPVVITADQEETLDVPKIPPEPEAAVRPNLIENKPTQ